MVTAVSEEDVHNVITETIIRHGIEVEGLAEKREEKRRTMKLSDVVNLSLSFCNIKKIENLDGLTRLTKLQLDNNVITKIENLEHLTNLTWLDLSFNQITEIRGLDKLTKLQDLSLTHNEIGELENLDSLVNLNVLSIANNKIGRGKPGQPPPEVATVAAYLSNFKNLRLLNLQDNPISKRDDYKWMILAYLSKLVYLDFRRVDPKELDAAIQQHLDVNQAQRRREEEERQMLKQAEENRKNEARLREANLWGLESLFEDMLRDNTDYIKLSQVGSVTDKTGEFKDQYKQQVEGFKVEMFAEHRKKQKEHEEFKDVIDKLVGARDTRSRELVREFERLKKHTIDAVEKNPELATAKIKVPLDRLDELSRELMDIESNTSDNLRELNEEFFRNYNALAERSRSLISNFFQNVRELEQNLLASMQEKAVEVLEQMASDKPEESKLVNHEALHNNPEIEAMVRDKEAFLGAVAGCHEANTSKIDDLEAELVGNEMERAKALSEKYTNWAYKRNRDRVMEIWSMHERHRSQLLEHINLEDTAA